jgi:hypothetical protein
MDELYEDLTTELDRLYVHEILDNKEWRSTNFVYMFIIDMSAPLLTVQSWQEANTRANQT